MKILTEEKLRELLERAWRDGHQTKTVAPSASVDGVDGMCRQCVHQILALSDFVRSYDRAFRDVQAFGFGVVSVSSDGKCEYVPPSEFKS